MKTTLPLALFVGLSSAVSAQVIDQQPNGALALYSTENVGTNAENFQIIGTNYDITTVTIWGTWDTSGQSNSDKFNLIFHDNEMATPNDRPGNVLQTYTDLAPSVTPTGSMMTAFGVQLPEYAVKFVLPSTLNLGPGTYWLEAYSTGSSGSNDQFAWGFSDVDFVTGLPCMAWASQTPGSSWNVCTNFFFADDLSLKIEGSESNVIFCFPPNLNSTGFPAVLVGSSSSGVGSGLHLECTGGVPNQFGYILVGTAATDPGQTISDGRLCLDITGGNQIGRYNVAGGVLNSVGQFDAAGILQNIVGTATSSGGSGFDVPNTLPTIGGTIQAGQTWYFQAWYRDNGGSANFSNALGSTF